MRVRESGPDKKVKGISGGYHKIIKCITMIRVECSHICARFNQTGQNADLRNNASRKKT